MANLDYTDGATDKDTDSYDRAARLKEMFEDAKRLTATARDQSEIDLDYYHGKQWTEEEKKALEKRKQPLITYNVIRGKIEGICGVEEQSDTSPKAWPRTPDDGRAAEVATDTLRFVCDISRFNKTRIDVLKDMIVCGTGGVIIEAAQGDGGKVDINIRKLRWETIFTDPYSRESDFSDATYLGSALWMNEDDAISLYGEDTREMIESALDDNSLTKGDSYRDRPEYGMWADRRKRRVLIVEMFHRERGEWHHSIYTGSGVIYSEPSTYLDESGNPSCPIELVSAYIDRDNQRYGVIRDMRSVQDEINHRRSKMLHLLNTRQTFRASGTIASDDPQKMRRELNKPDGDIELTKTATWGQNVGVIDASPLIQGQYELLQDAMTRMDREGVNNAMMGRGTENQSGRAILAQQQAGLQQLATLYASHNDWELRVYRQIWARAKQYWTAPMWIRVTDDLGSPQFVQVNEPVFDENQQPVVDPQTGQPQMTNRIAEMGVDLIVDRTPASANIDDETFRELVALMKEAGLPNTPDMIKAIIATSPLRQRVKKPLIDAMDAQQQGDPEVKKLELRKAIAEIMKEEAQALNYGASAEKSQAEAQLLGLQNVQQTGNLMGMWQQLQGLDGGGQVPPQQPPPAPPPMVPGQPAPPQAGPMGPPPQLMPQDLAQAQPEPPPGGF